MTGFAATHTGSLTPSSDPWTFVGTVTWGSAGNGGGGGDGRPGRGNGAGGGGYYGGGGGELTIYSGQLGAAGGGCYNTPVGRAGGSGVVVVRYKI